MPDPVLTPEVLDPADPRVNAFLIAERTNPFLFSTISTCEKRRFLIAYAQSGSLRTAGRYAGVHWTCHTYWMDTDEDYATAFAYAKKMSCGVVNDEITSRAFDRTDPHSHILLILLAKALMPELYRDNAQTQVNIDRPLEVTIRREG